MGFNLRLSENSVERIRCKVRQSEPFFFLSLWESSAGTVPLEAMEMDDQPIETLSLLLLCIYPHLTSNPDPKSRILLMTQAREIN